MTFTELLRNVGVFRRRRDLLPYLALFLFGGSDG